MKSVASVVALTLLALAGSDALTGELATAPIAAVIGTDTAHPAECMRGIRFTLEDNGGIDLAYLDDTELQALLVDLEGIEGGIPDLKAEGGPASRRPETPCGPMLIAI